LRSAREIHAHRLRVIAMALRVTPAPRATSNVCRRDMIQPLMRRGGALKESFRCYYAFFFFVLTPRVFRAAICEALNTHYAFETTLPVQLTLSATRHGRHCPRHTKRSPRPFCYGRRRHLPPYAATLHTVITLKFIFFCREQHMRRPPRVLCHYCAVALFELFADDADQARRLLCVKEEPEHRESHIMSPRDG